MKTKPAPVRQVMAKFFKEVVSRSSVAVMASIISVCALGVSLYQAKLSREQQLASVWPYLSIGGFGSANEERQTWGVRVVNNGLGPGIIERVELRMDGKPMPYDLFLDSLYTLNARIDSVKTINYASTDLGSGSVLAAGATEEWISFEHIFSGRPPKTSTSQQFRPKISLSIYYKSLYDEHWLSCLNCPDTGEDEVRKLD